MCNQVFVSEKLTALAQWTFLNCRLWVVSRGRLVYSLIYAIYVRDKADVHTHPYCRVSLTCIINLFVVETEITTKSQTTP